VGARTTLLGAAVIGGVITMGALFLPGMRDVEGKEGEAEHEAMLVPPQWEMGLILRVVSPAELLVHSRLDDAAGVPSHQP
jgi:hypothetical protein